MLAYNKVKKYMSRDRSKLERYTPKGWVCASTLEGVIHVSIVQAEWSIKDFQDTLFLVMVEVPFTGRKMYEIIRVKATNNKGEREARKRLVELKKHEKTLEKALKTLRTEISSIQEERG